MDPLDQLIDIAEPTGVSFWPMAWGWWVVIALTALSLLVAVYLFVKQWRRNRPKRIVKKYLVEQLNQGTLTVSSANGLLKRLCMTYLDRQQVAALHGNAWVNALQKSIKPSAKNQKVAENLSIFSHTQYQQHSNLSAQQVFTVTQDWLNALDIKRLQQFNISKAEHV